jgi:hypothetical protein
MPGPLPAIIAWPTLLLRALAYPTIVALAGALGSSLYRSRLQPQASPALRKLVESSIAGWVWIPAIILLLRLNSPWAIVVAAIGASFLAISIRQTAPSTAEPPSTEPQHRQLFTEFLQTTPLEWHAILISLCLYSVLIALAGNATLAACGFVAQATFLFLWKRSSTSPPSSTANKPAARRLAPSILPAILITIVVLLLAADRATEAANAASAQARLHPPASREPQPKPPNNPASGRGGYMSVVLRPPSQKMEIVAPLPTNSLFHGDHLTRPLVIRFDGEYWYFQWPERQPGPSAHIAHGTPLAVAIRSNTTIPLTMEAHQALGSPLPLACCREAQVEIENRDNQPGILSLEMILTDSASAERTRLSLGQQPIQSSTPGHFAVKTAPVRETLHFPVPAHAPLHQFDQITLVIWPDPARLQTGAKIAIQQFELIPR